VRLVPSGSQASVSLASSVTRPQPCGVHRTRPLMLSSTGPPRDIPSIYSHAQETQVRNGSTNPHRRRLYRATGTRSTSWPSATSRMPSATPVGTMAPSGPTAPATLLVAVGTA
jgi:hypothetical protein